MDVPPAIAALLAAASLQLTVTGRRADVILAAPQHRNPQTPATWRALAAVSGWLDGRADVVVVRALGPSFSAGLDRRAFTADGLPGGWGLTAMARLDDQALDRQIAEFQEGFTGWREAAYLSIAAVQGHAVGAGFQLALALDLRIMADDVQLAMRETALGLVPDLGGTCPLVEAVGYSRALEICATGRPVGATEALSLGLAQQVVPVAELGAAVDRLAGTLLAGDPAAIAATKHLLGGAARSSPGEQLAAERQAQTGRLRALAARP